MKAVLSMGLASAKVFKQREYMKIKSVLAAVAIAAASVSSFAGNYSTSFDSDGFANIFKRYAANTGTSFNDTWSFTGVTAGTYDIQGDLSGTNVSFSSVVLDGHSWDLFASGTAFRFASVTFTGTQPVLLSVAGTKSGSAISNYTGSVTVTAVPEPETYAMLLAGLGLMGGIARRRKQAAKA
ncbi:FxDxF family PEP-CTERM protein [Rhodoferax saidenbachensis]|uniref:Ice-binding protein C-terminal domain-containing protein n=1 Tax=Rhodoferax saidenbachensis TaxID=1484693 RepID=A0ABU1ZJ93_9BURK|nr:FxDxF family PEP-CTERM protein [Rhodoferax saidenbachensis]MDR7305608.1 hypothetical protein [Rhodoferax saidenbachensis]